MDVIFQLCEIVLSREQSFNAADEFFAQQRRTSAEVVKPAAVIVHILYSCCY